MFVCSSILSQIRVGSSLRARDGRGVDFRGGVVVDFRGGGFGDFAGMIVAVRINV
jgi:hypothetical protein